jgi:uncharacterized membrane protein
MYRGPWPPPEMVAELEKLFPGWGQRLLELTEKQIQHRHSLEQKQADRDERRMDRGQLFGFLIAALALASSATTAIKTGGSWPGAIVALCIAIVGVGGPAVARILATKFKFPSDKSK